MSERAQPSGPQFRSDRPVERQAVRTTIVGGRPPGSGTDLGAVPHGIEVLVRKASVDEPFREQLLADRAAAAAAIGLNLDPAERAMLSAVPAAQLESVIGRTSVPQEHRRAFLGQAAAAMVAALAAMHGDASAAAFGTPPAPAPTGIRPDEPKPVATHHAVYVIAERLELDAKTLTANRTLASLRADASAMESLRRELERVCEVVLPPKLFDQLTTIQDVVDAVELGKKLKAEVIATVAEVARIEPGELTLSTTLAEWNIVAARRAGIRRKLAADYHIFLDWNEFQRLKTVGDVVGAVHLVLHKKALAAALKQKKELEKEQEKKILTSRGVRPDIPPRSFGVRPDKPRFSAGGGVRP